MTLVRFESFNSDVLGLQQPYLNPPFLQGVPSVIEAVVLESEVKVALNFEGPSQCCKSTSEVIRLYLNGSYKSETIPVDLRTSLEINNLKFEFLFRLKVKLKV